MEEGSQPERGQSGEHTRLAVGGSGTLTWRVASLFSPGEIKQGQPG